MELSADIKIGGTAGDPSVEVPATRTISTTAPLHGGGDLSADRTISITLADSSSNGYLSATDWITFNSKVPTTRNVNTTAPITGSGTLVSDLTIGINQATSGTDGYLKAADWVTFSGKMTNPMASLGDIIYGGASGTPTKLSVGATGTVLHGGSTPSYSAVVESDIALSANSTNNASTTKHGFLLPLSNNSNQWLDGSGNWSTPSAGITAAYTSVGFDTTTSVVVTHNFGAYPVIQAFNESGVQIAPETVTQNSLNRSTITFSPGAAGTIVATLGSPQRQKVVVTAADYTASISDRIINVSVAGKSVYLPTSVNYDGMELIVDNSSTGDIYLYPYGTESIEGESLQTLPYNSAIHCYAASSAWRIY